MPSQMVTLLAQPLIIDGALGNSTSTLGVKSSQSQAGNDSTAKFTVTGTKAAVDLNGDGDTTDPGEGAELKRKLSGVSMLASYRKNF